MLIEKQGLKGKADIGQDTITICYEDGQRAKITEPKFWMDVYEGKLLYKLSYAKEIAPHFDEKLIHFLCELIDKEDQTGLKMALLILIENMFDLQYKNVEYHKAWARVYIDIKYSGGQPGYLSEKKISPN